MAAFTWIPIYKELALKLLDYRERQAELVAVLDELQALGLKTIPPDDLPDKDGEATFKVPHTTSYLSNRRLHGSTLVFQTL